MNTSGLPARKTCRTSAIALAASTLLGVFSANALGETHWATGTRLQKQLAQRQRISWSGNPLRPALGNLSRVRQVAVLIDRRVDPGQQLDVQLDDLPLLTILHEIARDRQLGVALLGPVAYFGPPEASSRLRTVAQLRKDEIRPLPTAVERTFLLPKPIAWDDFATPRDLLAQLAAQNGLEMTGTDRVPHDLWAAADLPPLSLVDRLTLILIQFDLTFDVASEGKVVSLVPLPEEVALVRSYPGGRDPQDLAKRLAVLAPEARIKVAGNWVYVSGLLEAHERIANPNRRPPQQNSGPAPGNGDKTFTGTVSGPLGQLLDELAARFQLELQIDRAALEKAGVSLDRYVSVKIRDATLDQVFRAVVEPGGVSYRRRGKVVEISPAP